MEHREAEVAQQVSRRGGHTRSDDGAGEMSATLEGLSTRQSLKTLPPTFPTAKTILSTTHISSHSP